MLHGEAAVMHQAALDGRSRYDKQDHDRGKDHEVGVEEDEHTSVVEAPFALEAAGGLGHAPRGNQQSENLPPGAVKILNMRKAGKVEAGGECAQREENSARERFLAQAED